MPLHKPKRLGFFAMLLALLGIGSCSEINNNNMAMYGTPAADWSVKGKVLDPDGKPIAGIQVILGKHSEDSPSVIWDVHYRPIDTLVTGADGSYSYQQHGFPLEHLQIDTRDIDGTAGGGEFQDATLLIRNIEYKDPDYDGWYVGKADIAAPDIKLKKK